MPHTHDEYLAAMIEARASDLILKSGSFPAVRVDGEIRFLEERVLDEAWCESVFGAVVKKDGDRRRFEEENEIDIAVDRPDVGRFRANVFRQSGQLGLVFRHIQTKVPGFGELHLPVQAMTKLAGLKRGLVLVTGIAGSGKSTTLASLVEHINQHRRCHVVTIEDPIEFLFKDKKSILNQREIGLDTHDFATALKHVVRQSPDVILIGEMRDKETMEAAVNAAETGHLVFSTLHTVNAIQTVERIINYFPPHQHALIRLQLSMVLEGVVSQRLLVKKDGRGRVPAIELLMATPTIREILYEGRTRDVYSALKEGAYYGTQTFNQSLKQLFEDDLVTLEDALAAADNPDELKLEIRGITKGTQSGMYGSTM
ncbi:MAG: PilT/PilU family type 4a pilus ATPase [Planctomycetes bacterium]|nr:PilT/PilU family type 4a pilus ATPase [Planctomycetota bacterium]